MRGAERQRSARPGATGQASTAQSRHGDVTISSDLRGHTRIVTSSAPRLPWPLVEAVRSLDAPDRSVASVWRDACAFADANDFQRPSYEQIRRLVRRERAIRELPSAVDAVVDGWLRARSPASAGEEALRRARERKVARAWIDLERSWRPTGDREAGS